MPETFLPNLAQQGLLGLLLVIALGAVFFLYKEAKKERDDRLVDMKDVWTKDIQFREELKTLLNNILDLIRAKK